MNSKSINRKSQFELLREELAAIRSSFRENELRNSLLQVEAMLSESDLIRNYEESEYSNPIDTLRGNLIGLSDLAGISGWYAILSIYLFNRIQETGSESNSRLVELALQALNVSKGYTEKAGQLSKIEARKEKQRKSKKGTHANIKGNEPLDRLKKAAFREYEAAIQSILDESERSSEKRSITYFSIAEIVYVKIEKLNRDKNGQKLIGRNGKPVGALAQIFKIAVSEGKLRSTIDYRKGYAP